VTFRHAFSWKPIFYDALLPAIRRLGPPAADAVVKAIGRASLAWPPRRRAMADSARRASEAIGAGWNARAVGASLAATVPKFLARDYLLEGASDAAFAARFDVAGLPHLRAAMAGGRGVVLVGSHMGGHMAALHWLYRGNLPLRLLVQRPQHVSPTLQRHFDRADGPHPQSGLFLRRGLPPGTAAERLIRARAALRDGLAVYLAGDIPWASPNARPGRLLGQLHPFLSIWADLAILARAPVVPVFCTHRPGGRYALSFDAPWSLAPGSESAALERFLKRLEAEIRAHPADAVAYLTWPCYGPSYNPPPRRPHKVRAKAVSR